MEAKTSVVKSITSKGVWTNKKGGKMHGYEILMENGDLGVYNSTSDSQTKFVIGQKYDYQFESGDYPKIKPVYNKPFQANGSAPPRSTTTVRQTSLQIAVDILKHNTDKIEFPHVIHLADKLNNWIYDKEEIKENVN